MARITSATTFLYRKNLCICGDEPEIISAKERDKIHCHCEACEVPQQLGINQVKLMRYGNFATLYFGLHRGFCTDQSERPAMTKNISRKGTNAKGNSCLLLKNR